MLDSPLGDPDTPASEARLEKLSCFQNSENHTIKYVNWKSEKLSREALKEQMKAHNEENDRLRQMLRESSPTPTPIVESTPPPAVTPAVIESVSPTPPPTVVPANKCVTDSCNNARDTLSGRGMRKKCKACLSAKKNDTIITKPSQTGRVSKAPRKSSENSEVLTKRKADDNALEGRRQLKVAKSDKSEAAEKAIDSMLPPGFTLKGMEGGRKSIG